ncbi:sensor domain-containing diguanylate cyclase [Heyndrickxia vini]|uniref:Diguanylate cyclase n=1 Tax=Heyndrickxia vini TaxID=1476025 RepID=A0ABX7E3Z2_9BACI|nr:diguanylate cyclase [Heyndrickxia vini]QQZ10187.1 diguanylate cyclase [Heyndrickxia vini]
MSSFFSSIITNRQYTKNNEFHRSNNLLILSRIKIASIILFFLTLYFFYIDIFLLEGIPNTRYRYILTSIHLLCFTISIVYLLIYRKLSSIKDNTKWSTSIINIYIFGYILGGAVASINSQLLNGNTSTYLIVLICAAVIFPIRPKHFFMILCIIHIGFLLGLSSMDVGNRFDLVSKQINTTGTATFAFILNLVFYMYRKKEFESNIKIKQSEENLRNLFEVNPFPQTLSSLETGEILLINQKAIDFFYLSTEKILPNLNTFYKNKEERSTIIERLKKDGSAENYTLELENQDGSSRWVLVNYKLIDYMDKQCILAGLTDITDVKRKEEELLRHASFDMLTGAFNRRRGMELLENRYQMAKMNHQEFVICFVDVNNLKIVNDQFGHQEGDELVNTICQIINQQLDEKDLLFRYGGDEFIIVFFEKSLDHAEDYWKQIHQKMYEINIKASKPYQLSVSHGLFHYHSGIQLSLEEMIHCADKEMYIEKNRVKNFC